VRRFSRLVNNLQLGQSESGYLHLIYEAIDLPLQFPKSRKMIFQPRKASFASEKSVTEICEFSTASGGNLLILDLREERRH
jgi:hypothetical protein